MVDVGYPKVEGGDEYCLRGREVGEQVKRGQEGAENKFFGYGALLAVNIGVEMELIKYPNRVAEHIQRYSCANQSSC